MLERVHTPVLTREVLEALLPRPGETYLDCTAGRGGHAAAMAKAIVPGGTVILNDADEENLHEAEKNVRGRSKGTLAPNDTPTPNPLPQGGDSGESISVRAFHGNFAMVPRQMEEAGLSADMVLADLGFSSTHIDDPARGFAFSKAGPLDMRFDVSRGMSAAEYVNQASERDLARLIREFGEDSSAGRIARAIVAARAEGPIETTDRLAEVVRSVVGRKPGGVDPATKTFQALRIAVNDEIGSLEALLSQVVRGAERVSVVGEKGGGTVVKEGGVGGVGWLAPGARVAILTFHSLEDRPVKGVFADICKRGLAVDLARGGVTASPEEIEANPRARSARLRAIRLGRV